jgi:putative heme-binding domain-containing protein
MRILVVLLLPLLLEAQHGQTPGAVRNPAIRNPEAIAAGAKLYATSCAGCHGPDGSGGRGPNLIHRFESHPLKDDEIFSTIRNGVPGADMPATKLPDDDMWKLVAFIHALTGPANEGAVPGAAAAGERIFWSAKAGCGECHAIFGRGSKMGPDLSNIGGSRPLGAIREAILPAPKTDPSRDYMLAGKEGVTVAMKNGTVVKGIARNRSNYSIQLVDRQGQLHLIQMADVREVTVEGHTIMPQDYATRLSGEELRDLLAYLARQSVRAPETPRNGQEN